MPILVLTLFWVAGMLWPGGQIPSMAAERPRIQRLQIVTPQWEAQTNEDGTGLFFEIVRRVYEPEGIQISYHFTPWKRARSMVSSKEADAMLCVWREDAREEGQLTPRFPLFVEHTAAVFRKDVIAHWSGIKTLDGKRAVWIRGYDYHTYDQLAQVRFASWQEVDDYAHAWLLLDNKRYDVYIDALIDIEHYIASQPVDMTLYRLEVLWGQNAYVAFSTTEKSKELIEIYDRRIQELFKTGVLKVIYDKWGTRFTPAAWQLQMH